MWFLHRKDPPLGKASPEGKSFSHELPEVRFSPIKLKNFIFQLFKHEDYNLKFALRWKYYTVRDSCKPTWSYLWLELKEEEMWGWRAWRLRRKETKFEVSLYVGLKKEMVTHSSILAWKIPWTEKPCRLQFMGSQRVGHDWETSFHFICRRRWNASQE